MIRNYCIIAWRNITRHKIYTAINVLGLALGICACIVIYLITSYDLDFDKFHPDKERIYRIVGEFQRSSGEQSFINSPVEDVAGFQNQVPGFEATAGIHLYRVGISISDSNKIKKFDSRIEGGYSTSIIITWPEYFSIFKYEWLAGSSATALSGPFKVVLSEKRARKYFGNIPLTEMIGKTVTYDDSLQVKVSGIVKDWDKKTDFGYTDFISIETTKSNFLKKQHLTNDWSSLSPHRSMAFIKLGKNTSAASVNREFARYIKTHVKLDNPGSKLVMWLQPLSEIHFTKEFHRGDDGDGFRKAYMPIHYVLMGIAGFILLLGLINYINLSTAQSMQRAKEIGVRKVLGSSKRKIVYQFLAETLIITLFSVFVSILLVNPALSAFSAYIPEGVSFNVWEPPTLLFVVTLTIVTSLLAGFYPAKVLASYLPVLSLKGTAMQKGTNKVNLRKSLIVFQFTISLVFIIGALVIGKQIRFMSNSDKGFNTDAVITAYNWNDHEGKLKVFANNIREVPGVDKVILQGTAPMGFAQNIDNFKYKKKEEDSRPVLADIGDRDFIPFYGMKILAGTNMPAGDSLTGLIINETYSKTLGFTDPQQAIGEYLHQQSYPDEKPYPIVGVVADYHTGSFHEAIQPVVIENVMDRKHGVAIKLARGNKNINTTIARLDAEWKKIFPESTFNYSFLNESIAALFDQEEKTIWLMNAAMAITIFISCMGLFGLSMFTAERKRKEIGIRKVLGATASNIATMLSKDFVKLILIAVLVASPLAWYFMNQWLQDFAYRTQISWWLFVIAAGLAILIAMITISFLAIKAATANPIKSLRTE